MLCVTASSRRPHVTCLLPGERRGTTGYSGGSCGGKDREGKREKNKKQMAGRGPGADRSRDGAACHGTSCSLSLSVAAVGVTTRAVCVNSRPRLNRLASRRGSFAENSANLPPAASTTLTYTVSLSFSSCAQTSPQNCVEGGQRI